MLSNTNDKNIPSSNNTEGDSTTNEPSSDQEEETKSNISTGLGDKETITGVVTNNNDKISSDTTDDALDEATDVTSTVQQSDKETSAGVFLGNNDKSVPQDRDETSDLATNSPLHNIDVKREISTSREG